MFQPALVTLVPTFDQARINWRGPNTYDDYERIAEALFDSIVRDALTKAPSVAKAYPPGRYGVHQPGRELSRIYVNDPEERLALFELETRTNRLIRSSVKESTIADGNRRPGPDTVDWSALYL
jgi:hypothetical protein